MQRSSSSLIQWFVTFLVLGMGSALANVTTYNTAGTTTWICPEGVFSVTVECWGGGGAGGAAIRTSGSGQAAGGGGGGGAYACKYSIPVTPGVAYSIVIPAAAVNLSGNGRVNGGSVVFAGNGGATVTAAGGQGGAGALVAAGAGEGGAGGTTAASDGDVVFAGGAGFMGVTASNVAGGAGGGGAGDASAGGDAIDATAGTGGATGGGDGGAGHTVNNTDGQSGNTPGGGGGGAKANSTTQMVGGAGGRGQIRITDAVLVPVDPFGVEIHVLPESGNVQLNWTSAFGASYGVEATTNLAEGNWEPMRMNLWGTGASVSYTEPLTASKRFFRVLRINPPGLGINPVGLEPEPANGITVTNVNDVAATCVSSFYMPLDLDAQTKASSLDPTTAPLVPLGPRLVAGEGPHPENHTVVRILTEYQIPEVQFLAFPPEVRGGVGVNCGVLDGELAIVAHPLLDETNEIRVFDSYGGYLRSIAPGSSVTPPYAVAVGNFITTNGSDEIVVVGKNPRVDPHKQNIPVEVYGGDGTLLKTFTVDRSSVSQSAINLFEKEISGEIQLMLYDSDTKRLHQVNVNTETASSVVISTLPAGVNVYDSVYTDRDYNAGGNQDLVSTLYKVAGGVASPQDVGKEENIFWFAVPGWLSMDEADRAAYGTGTYIKRARFNFLHNLSAQSEVVQLDDIEGRSYEEWTATDLHDYMSDELTNEYTVGVPKVWSPAFSQRWDFGALDNMAAMVNDIYQLSRYLALDRSNETIQSGYNGSIKFWIATLCYEAPGLNEFYSYGIREGLRQLVVQARQQQDWLIGVEPNHEHEVVTGENDGVSFGDYNPYNIAGFYRHLLFLYGSLEGVNQRFGTPFSHHFFDAPRDLGRGAWDAYGNKDGFSQAWYDYNASVVYRRVGDSFREALLAGFPPESITCHQVPDSYAQKASEIGFDRESPRISPIDWMLTAGTSFGCSRYGNWYQNTYNAANGLHSSGFDNVNFVEYSPFTSSDEHAYNQLRYMMTNGIHYVGGFAENASLQPQQNALLRVLAENDQPRRGSAGGISEVRPFNGASSYDIVALGTGEKCTGLIKSVKSNGKFEGSVYVAPFHAHVDISTLVTNRNIAISTAEEELAVVEEPYCGMQVEFVFSALANLEPNNGLVLKIYHDGMAMPFQEVTVPVTTTEKNYRLIHKLQLPVKALTYKMATTTGQAIDVSDLNVYLHTEKNIRLRQEVYLGERHKGGVTFDILKE